MAEPSRTKAEILDLMVECARMSAVSEYDVRRYDDARYQQLAKARRLRREDILDRESIPLSPIGRRTVIAEMRPHPEAADLILSWASRPVGDRITPALAVIGQRGLGKTVAAAWWCADVDGRYVRSTELVRLHRASWGEERERWDGYVRAKYLVVDEIGAERQERAEVRAMLEEVIDARQSRRTLYLGNISSAQWAERLSARAESRWAETGYTLELRAGRDMRRRV